MKCTATTSYYDPFYDDNLDDAEAYRPPQPGIWHQFVTAATPIGCAACEAATEIRVCITCDEEYCSDCIRAGKGGMCKKERERRR